MSISKRSFFRGLYFLFNAVLICISANCYLLVKNMGGGYWIPLMTGVFIAANLMPFFSKDNVPTLRLRICHHGTICLRLFLVSAVISLGYHILLAFHLLPQQWTVWLLSAAISVLAEGILFWNGILSIYTTSLQLGIRHRVTGILCGLIPVANVVLLWGMIRKVSEEVRFETAKAEQNQKRRQLQICRTRYPILLVHGVFFRDHTFPNYWGRIPAELIQNGAVLYYGNHHSAASVADSAKELAARIEQIQRETGCEKVNIIAHSKGGLDCRYVASHFAAARYIASLTMINTPQRGCEFADYLLHKVPFTLQQKTALVYNTAMKKLGDRKPDFIAAVQDLTASRCDALNREMQIPETIYLQSVGSKLNRATSGKFPLNFSYFLVKYFDGDNDGLVSEKSFRWGDAEDYTFLTVEGKRGISHGDMIDLYRENIPGFDVREFYVQLVAGLKQKGL